MKKTFLPIICLMAFAAVSAQEQKKTPYEFIPKNYTLYSEVRGDLNKDGIDDCVLIIEATEPSYSEFDEYRDTTIYHYRRGVVIAFKKGENYELILQNADFFASDNEDGGVYYVPVLDWEIKRGNLIFTYEHGRYGNIKYTFRYQNNDFELIGYDEYGGQYHYGEHSINFLTKKYKQTLYEEEYTELEGTNYKPSFHWQNVKVDKFYKLSEGTVEETFDNVFDNYIWAYREKQQ